MRPWPRLQTTQNRCLASAIMLGMWWCNPIAPAAAEAPTPIVTEPADEVSAGDIEAANHFDEIEAPQAPRWERRLEVGPDFIMASRPFATALGETNIGYGLAPGWGLHLHWNVLPWLRLHPYFVDVHHAIRLPPDGLRTDGNTPLPSGTAIADATVDTFSFGAQLAPSINFTDRFRAWVGAGIGWGRLEFPELMATEPGSDTPSVLRERSGVFVEFPISLGVSFDIIERWLAIEWETTAAPAVGQSGAAFDRFQSVAEDGTTRDVGPFGAPNASFLQKIGLSLIL